MRPIMIEFTGTPEAGKTTTIKRVAKDLQDEGYKVRIIQESAELVPKEFPKGSWDANRWMRLKTVSEILRSMYMPVDIVLIDRGVIDLKFFGIMFLEEGKCKVEDYISVVGVATDELNPNLLIAFTSNPSVSLQRRGGPGRIVTMEYLSKYNKTLKRFYETIDTPKSLIDTSEMSVDEACQKVGEIIMKIMEAR